MANSEYITLTGKAYWARIFPENKDVTGFDGELTDSGGWYTVEMELDDESLRKLSMTKSQAPSNGKTLMNEDGEPITVYRFKRYHEKRNKAGELLEWASGAPKVTHPDGTVWTVEDHGLVGNGSELQIKVCVYKAGKMYGTRLESVVVTDLVEPPAREAVA